MVNVLGKAQEISQIGKSIREKQKNISVIEVFYTWDILTSKYDLTESTEKFMHYADDAGLKLVMGQILKLIRQGITTCENLLEEYGVPFPPRPPEVTKGATEIESITNNYIYNSSFDGLQMIIPVLTTAYMLSTSPQVRGDFRNILDDHLNVYSEVLEYGKLKDYIQDAPIYMR